MNQQYGVVAVLDALGAKTYSESEISRFLKSREIVLELLRQNTEGVADDLKGCPLETFTFNDTVVIVLNTGTNQPNYRHIRAFCKLMRTFVVDSLVNKILFRGCISIGSFRMDVSSNTIMGVAVTDAAEWYDKADWVGLIATPHATLQIRFEEERGERDWKYLMLDYNVPLNGGQYVRLKAVNWPKVFLVRKISPCKDGEAPRVKLLELLSWHQVPRGTEGKYFNTVEFFDHAIAEAKKEVPAKDTKKKSDNAQKK